MKDSNILDYDEDELISVDLVEKQKLKEHLGRMKDKNTSAYNIYEEAERLGSGERSEILPQYGLDDPKVNKTSQGFKIKSTSGSQISGGEDNNNNNNNNNISGESVQYQDPRGQLYTLTNEDENKVETEYMTREEMAQTFKKKEKKNRQQYYHWYQN